MDGSELLQHDKSREILQWLSRQDEKTLLEVFRYKVSKHNNLCCNNAGKEDLISLLQAALHCGYGDELAFKSSRTISQKAAQKIGLRRKARAGAYMSHRQKVQSWLAKNIGKINDLRQTGLSWRQISKAVHEEYKINICYSTLQKHWEKFCHAQSKNIFHQL
ncbi:MAG: hypothetical protein R3Y11_12785 [Pseudomonadota bacterium]